MLQQVTRSCSISVLSEVPCTGQTPIFSALPAILHLSQAPCKQNDATLHIPISFRMSPKQSIPLEKWPQSSPNRTYRYCSKISPGQIQFIFLHHDLPKENSLSSSTFSYQGLWSTAGMCTATRGRPKGSSS